MDEKRKQVANQCRAVAHLCKALAEVNEDHARMFDDEKLDAMDELVESIGNRTARHMEMLGNILNSMDANDEADDWMEPVFAAAHRLFPQLAERAPHTESANQE